jgi:hypothetical protein
MERLLMRRTPITATGLAKLFSKSSGDVRLEA